MVERMVDVSMENNNATCLDNSVTDVDTQKSILGNLTLRNEMDESYTFFDRIEGLLYPGYVSSTIRKSTREEQSTIHSIGYEAAFTNPARNFGYYVQQSGKMGLETFKLSNVNGLSIDINFEFMNNDPKVYTVNNMIIFFAYMRKDQSGSVSFKSSPLKAIGGIKGQTRFNITKYGVKFHHEPMEDFFSTVEKDLLDIGDNTALELVFEVYTK